MRILLIGLILGGCVSSSPSTTNEDDYAIIQSAYLESGEPTINLIRASTQRRAFSICEEEKCARDYFPNQTLYVKPGYYFVQVHCRREPTAEPDELEVFPYLPLIEIFAEKGKIYTVDCYPVGNEFGFEVFEGT